MCGATQDLDCKIWGNSDFNGVARIFISKPLQGRANAIGEQFWIHLIGERFVGVA